MNKNQLLKELTVTFVQEVLIKEALTPEKEQEYIDAIQSGSGPARERAMKKLLSSFQNLIFKNAQKLKGGAKAGVEMEDLVNAGREGLLKAINSYDPEFGTKLSTHAYRMVFDEMYKQAQQGRAVSLPANVTVLKSKIEKASQKFQAENGYEPSPMELEDILGIPAQEIEDAMSAKGGAASLDTPVGGEDGLDTGDTKADFLADPTSMDTDVDDAGGESTRKELDDLFDKAKLSANQREIINTYLTALKTVPERGVAKAVAQKLGKSQMNVSAAIKNIEKKLGLTDKGVKLSSLREYAEKRALLREALRKEVRAILNEQLGGIRGKWPNIEITQDGKEYSIEFDEFVETDNYGHSRSGYFKGYDQNDDQWQVDVSVGADYDYTGDVSEVEWNTLTKVDSLNEATQMDVDEIFDIVKQASRKSGHSLVEECEDLFSNVLDRCKLETADQIARQRANVFMREGLTPEELEARYEDQAQAEYGKSFDELDDEQQSELKDIVDGDLFEAKSNLTPLRSIRCFLDTEKRTLHPMDSEDAVDMSPEKEVSIDDADAYEIMDSISDEDKEVLMSVMK